MHARQILAIATLATMLTGASFAQVTGQTIRDRKVNQQERIGQGFAAVSSLLVRPGI